MVRHLKGTWLLIGLVLWLLINSLAEEQRKEKEIPLIDKLVKPARRPLTSEEVEKMQKLITNATSLKGWSLLRREAILALGNEIGHIAVIPVLEKISRDQQDDKDIRATAIRALACIPDEQAIEILIELLEEAEKTLKQNPKDEGAREVYGAAEEMLRHLIRLPTHLIDSKKSMTQNYKDYWEREKKKINLRERVFLLKILSH